MRLLWVELLSTQMFTELKQWISSNPFGNLRASRYFNVSNDVYTAGFVVCRFAKGEPDALVLQRLIVEEPYQRRGVGRSLLEVMKTLHPVVMVQSVITYPMAALCEACGFKRSCDWYVSFDFWFPATNPLPPPVPADFE